MLPATPDDAATDPYAAALTAFMQFTERSTVAHDPVALGQLAVEVMDAFFPDGTSAYYELDGEFAKARAMSASTTPALAAVVRQGLPRTMPMLALMFSTARAVFSEWNAAEQHVPESADYRAGAVFPIWRADQPIGVFGLGATHAPAFTERERLVYLAVGRALQLALERTWAAEAQDAELRQLRRRHEALEAFVALEREPAFLSDPDTVVLHAVRLVHLLFPGTFVRYWTLTGKHWVVQGEAGQPPAEGLLERLPVPESVAIQPLPHVARQLTERESVHVHGEVRGALEVTRRDSTPWSTPDRAALETVAVHLGLALERAGEVQRTQLRPQAWTEKVQAARDESLAFSEAVWLDLRRDLDRLTPSVEGEDARDRLNHLYSRLDALLDYAELTRRPMSIGLVDLGALTRVVQSELDGETLNRRIDWHVGHLPVVRGDREVLREVLRALLRNALTFTGDDARIEVWGEAHPEGHVVFVRDNGAGFDPAFAPHLFEPGSQLGDEGHGLGLAAVRHLVERHGGRVWAEGQPGQGATVMFSLPR
ncbi:signal transduction histidine kinase [Deinococcus metalli]|uniref:histidine kinase n=1 Tax=Deinococcus metalli TaxID=1141878 RepID=A0A7W8KH62_9DEIO|nr:ATP-binding protein [Deinococcus metalli]MBB5378117.1 signal transduction histidine kinase [Deinococcus metalli]GHF54575.1 hypothetical protein GCM10017781_33620 [Deinococcus metalli]